MRKFLTPLIIVTTVCLGYFTISRMANSYPSHVYVVELVNPHDKVVEVYEVTSTSKPSTVSGWNTGGRTRLRTSSGFPKLHSPCGIAAPAGWLLRVKKREE